VACAGNATLLNGTQETPRVWIPWRNKFDDVFGFHYFSFSMRGSLHRDMSILPDDGALGKSFVAVYLTGS
jgi:hypothetical protein